MKIIAKLSQEARAKLGIDKKKNSSFRCSMRTISSEELANNRNPRTPYIAI